MVLRLLLAALVVVNLGYWLWSLGSTSEAADREPQRLTQQIRPELLEIRRTTPPAPAGAAAPRPASAASADAPAPATAP